MTAGPIRCHEPGDGFVEAWPIPTDEQTLRSILGLILDEWWDACWFCVLVEGAAWELAAERRPTVSYEDGYLTVDFGHGHFHICIGPHAGAPRKLAARRRTHRAELFRRCHEGRPVSWGLRLFNGADEPQITVLLPNPLLDGASKLLRPPQWGRLRAWDVLRERYLGLTPDPHDRTAREFAYDPLADGARTAR